MYQLILIISYSILGGINVIVVILKKWEHFIQTTQCSLDYELHRDV